MFQNVDKISFHRLSSYLSLKLNESLIPSQIRRDIASKRNNADTIFTSH